MANRIAGNTIIIDSAAGNAFIVDTISNSAGQLKHFHVNQVSFWSSDSTGRMQLSETDTTNVIVSYSWITVGSNGAAFIMLPATQQTSFGQEQPLENLKMPTLTAGTAWIYLA